MHHLYLYVTNNYMVSIINVVPKKSPPPFALFNINLLILSRAFKGSSWNTRTPVVVQHEKLAETRQKFEDLCSTFSTPAILSTTQRYLAMIFFICVLTKIVVETQTDNVYTIHFYIIFNHLQSRNRIYYIL